MKETNENETEILLIHLCDLVKDLWISGYAKSLGVNQKKKHHKLKWNWIKWDAYDPNARMQTKQKENENVWFPTDSKKLHFANERGIS